MKLIHLSDLHLGKRVNEISMVEDQAYILTQILRIIDAEQPDAVLIPGDVYDKSVPSAEAVELLDDFLVRLAGRSLQVFISSGNHDSAERLAFGGRLMEGKGIHLSPVYNGTVTPITLSDDYGAVQFYLLPFVKPIHIRRFFPDEAIESYTDAVRVAIEQMKIDPTGRNVLLTHQFVTGASRCESEEISVGGTDNIDAAVFEAFDYVALGHIHNPQDIVPGKIRYCGTPLKYSFSECAHEKSVTVVELGEKGCVSVHTVPLIPLHDMREIRGTYQMLTAKETYQGTATHDYLHIILTDEEDVPEAAARLRVIYPNLMKLTYDNTRTRNHGTVAGAENVRQKSPLELFCELYEKMNGQPMSPRQKAYSQELIETIQEEMQ